MYVVYVLDKDGNPLMPTKRFGRVDYLLDNKLAKVYSVKPFTIQLLYDSTKYIQPLYGGTDPGRTNIGEAVINQKGEVVYAAKVETRNLEIPKLNEKRKLFRKVSRRGERLRRKRRAKKCGTIKEFYEGRKLPGFKNGVIKLKDIINTESKFNNKKRHLGWLTPTANQLVQTHINAIKLILKILPVTYWTLEYNKFAYMLMEDHTIRGMDFQNGRMKGYTSVKDYIYALQDGKCACCGNPIEHYHHIKPRHEGGSNLPENLIGLCKNCHEKIHHNDKLVYKINKIGLKKKYSGISILNISLPKIYNELCKLFSFKRVNLCSGYETKIIREKFNLDKDHHLDAICIALIGSDLDCLHYNYTLFHIKQFRNHNRSIIKSNCDRTYKLNNKVIAKNRNARIEQKTVSLHMWCSNYKKIYGDRKLEIALSNMKVVKSIRRYNNLSRCLPGTIFIYKSKSYIMSGQLSNGKYYRAYNFGTKNFSAKDCKILYKKSLLYI